MNCVAATTTEENREPSLMGPQTSRRPLMDPVNVNNMEIHIEITSTITQADRCRVHEVESSTDNDGYDKDVDHEHGDDGCEFGQCSIQATQTRCFDLGISEDSTRQAQIRPQICARNSLLLATRPNEARVENHAQSCTPTPTPNTHTAHALTLSHWRMSSSL